MIASLTLTAFTTAYSEQANIVKDLPLTDSKWQITENKNGVTHYSQAVKGCSLSAYKGVCVIDKPMDKIYSILKDVSCHPDWVAYCSSSTIVKKTSDEDVIQYCNFDVPWPFLNRDIVVHCVKKSDAAGGKIVIDGSAMKTPLVPLKKGNLRITDSKQRWILEQIQANKTKVTFIALTNIDGDVPALLKNLISKVIPSSSLENLKAYSMKNTADTPSGYIAKTDSSASN